MDFEEAKKNAVAMFGNAIRKSSAENPNVQQAAMALGQLLDQVAQGDPIPLDPLFEFMKESGYSDGSLMEIMFFFHARREMFGLDLQLPATFAQIPEDQRNEIALKMARQTTDGYMVKKREPTSPGSPAINEPGPGAYKKKKAAAGGSAARLAAMLGVLVVLGAVAAYVYFVKDPTAANSIVLRPEENTLGCERIIGAAPHGICYLTKEAAARPEDELEQAAADVRETLAARGFTNVRVIKPDGSRIP